MQQEKIEELVEKVREAKSENKILYYQEFMKGYTTKERALIIKALADERLLGVFKR